MWVRKIDGPVGLTAVDDGRARLIILLLGAPEILEY